jgi:hypothetical protein
MERLITQFIALAIVLVVCLGIHYAFEYLNGRDNKNNFQ